MTITMNDSHMVSIAQLKEFVKLSEKVEFAASSKKEMYEWIGEVLGRFKYCSRNTKKKDRGVILSYITGMTGLSRGQVKKLTKRKRVIGRIERINGTRHSFSKVYGAEDIARLIETDNAHGRIAGEATKRIMEREYEVYGDARYEKIRQISVSHLYNLRDTRQYATHALHVAKTDSVGRNIGLRQKPRPEGKPGFVRVDSVHQGDLDKEKGVYHINLMDEVTQWEAVGCVEGISEYFLEPLLRELLTLFPFTILGFHSDNGSEYINKTVARLLQKLHAEQTKSRSRHTNDNALVEGKNGSRVRKHMGVAHIPKKYAESINAFYRNHMNDYLNFHRPCGFSTLKIDRRGKEKKKYDTYLTPFEKLKTIKDSEIYLKPEVTIAKLEEIAREESDNASAAKMQKAKKVLFESFKTC